MDIEGAAWVIIAGHSSRMKASRALPESEWGGNFANAGIDVGYSFVDDAGDHIKKSVTHSRLGCQAVYRVATGKDAASGLCSITYELRRQ